MKTKLGLLLVMLSLAVWCDDSTDAEQPTDPKVDYKQPPSENQPESTVTDWTNRRFNRAVAAATKAQQRSDDRSQWLLENPKNPDPYKQRSATGEPEPKSAQAPVNSLRRSLQRGLVAYYPFNGNVKDESGNGANNVLQQAPTVRDGEAFFEGKSTFRASVANLPIGNSPRTLSMWITVSDDLDDTVAIIVGYWGEDKLDAPLGASFGFSLVKGLLYGWTHANAVSLGRSSSKCHLVMAYDSKQVTYFRNGVLLETKPLSLSTKDTRFFNVGTTTKWHQAFKGSIDDVRIYNRALSAAEVKSLYKYESKPPAKTRNNLLRKLAHFLRP